jgi:hypothetical protein
MLVHGLYSLDRKKIGGHRKNRIMVHESMDGGGIINVSN